MRKKLHYFIHEVNAMQDPKIAAMMSAYGFAGYGMYWAIIELLTKETEHRINIGGKYGIRSLAQILNASLTTVEQTLSQRTESLEKFIEDCVQEFGLLKSKDDYLYSESLDRRMEFVDERRRQASEAGKQSAAIRAKNKAKATQGEHELNEKSTVVEQNTNEQSTILNIKEKEKEKKSKGKVKSKKDISSDLPTEQTQEEVIRQHQASVFFNDDKFVVLWKEYQTMRQEKKYEQWTPTTLKAQLTKLFEYSNGKVELAREHITAAIAGGWKGIWKVSQPNAATGNVQQVKQSAHAKRKADLRAEITGTETQE